MLSCTKTDGLTELREVWEEGLQQILLVTKDAKVYPVVYVVLEGRHEQHYLHRYFKINQDWHISVDCRGDSLDTCLGLVTDAFSEDYPK